jgi:hypothetical protein
MLGDFDVDLNFIGKPDLKGLILVRSVCDEYDSGQKPIGAQGIKPIDRL